MEAGKYNVHVYNSLGQRIYGGLINHAGTNRQYNILAGKILVKGTYHLQINGGAYEFSKNITVD